MTKELGAFLAYLEHERNASFYTRRSYQTDLLQFAHFLKAKGFTLGTADPVLLRAYLVHLHELKQKKSSISRKLAALRSFFQFCLRKGWVEDNPAKVVASPKQDRPVPSFLSEKEMETFLADENFVKSLEKCFHCRRFKDQMEAVVRLAEQIGANSVKFNIVQPTERGEIMYERGETLNVKELIDIGRWVNTELTPTTKMRIVYSQPVAFQPLNKIFGSNNDCSICGIKGIIGVLPNGSYALCGIGEKIPELTFGSVDTDRLEDVWNKSKFILELRNGLPEKLQGICSQCSMKKICLGSCIAQNYYRCKNLWAPYWYCDYANGQGSFPETRKIPVARIVHD